MGSQKDRIDRIQEQLDSIGTPESDASSERIERIRKLLEARPEPITPTAVPPTPSPVTTAIPTRPPGTFNEQAAALLARQAYAPPGLGIPEYDPSAPVGWSERGERLLGPAKWWQEKVTEPIGAAATVAEAPGLLGLAGVPGFGGEFAWNPEQFPTQEGWREAYRENIPLGSLILTEAGIDPLNLIPGIGFVPTSRYLSMAGRGGGGWSRTAAREATRAPQLALPPGRPGRGIGDVIEAGGEVAPAQIPTATYSVATRRPRIVSASPENSLVIVSPQKPLGERLIFSGPRALRRAELELAQRSDIQVLPGNATAADVDQAAKNLPFDIRDRPPTTQATVPVTRVTEGGLVSPRPRQRQFQGSLDPEGLDALRSSLRAIESSIAEVTKTTGKRVTQTLRNRINTLQKVEKRIRDITKDTRLRSNAKLQDSLAELQRRAVGLRVGIENIRQSGTIPSTASPARQSLESLESQATQLRNAIDEVTGIRTPGIELEIPGVVARESVRRVVPPPTARALMPGQIQPSYSASDISSGVTRYRGGDVPPGVERVPVSRGRDIPYEADTPEEAARLREEVRARRAEYKEHVDSGAPDGPAPPPPPGGVAPEPPGSSSVPSPTNRLLQRSTAGQLEAERADQAMLRFHEAAIDNATREATDHVSRGNRLLQAIGIGTRRGVSLAARPQDIPRLNRLYILLHNPSKVASGELQVPPQLQEIYDDLRGLMDWESAYRLDFDPNMATVDDYFYRGWKPPEGMYTSTGAGRGNLVPTPSFKKPRSESTYEEMRELGFEPIHWNPYEQWKLARLQGVKYREQMELVEALKTLGDDMIRVYDGGPIPSGWRVPQVGPAFQGKPFAIIDSVTGNPRPMRTSSWIVRHKIANPLENLYGKPPDWGLVHVGGRDVDLASALDWLVFVPKRAKLFGSFFQQADFLTRGGVGSWHAMVNALRTGHPIEAVQHLAQYPGTARDVLGAYFRPNWRANLRSQLNSTKPLIEGRPGIHMKGISESGLSIQDVTIFPKDMDKEVRLIALESGLMRIAKTVPRFVLQVEGAMRRGLFEGVYPAAIVNDVQKNIAAVVTRTYPDLTDAQINSLIATLTNKRYSTIPQTQSVIQNRFLRESLRRLLFSMNESEGLLRQAAGAISPKSKERAFWIENWIGAYLFLMSTAEIIHFASTREFMPLDRFTPISGTNYGPLPFGYNRNFMSPTLPIAAKGGLELTLDIVGQLDTAFRVLDPSGFLQSRESVPIRAFTNQTSARNFYDQPIDQAGPGGVYSRTVQAAQDMFAPIGFGQAGAEIIRQLAPETGTLIAPTEERIGIWGQLIQASGINVRGEIINDALKRIYPEGPTTWSEKTYENRRKQLINQVFGDRTQTEKDYFKKELDKFLGRDALKDSKDDFFGGNRRR